MQNEFNLNVRNTHHLVISKIEYSILLKDHIKLNVSNADRWCGDLFFY